LNCAQAGIGTHTVQLKSTSNTLYPDRLQLDRPDACVIAQQYFRQVHLFVLSFPQGKNSARVSKTLLFQFFTYLKLRKS
jgi:hypothetical protein